MVSIVSTAPKHIHANGIVHFQCVWFASGALLIMNVMAKLSRRVTASSLTLIVSARNSTLHHLLRPWALTRASSASTLFLVATKAGLWLCIFNQLIHGLKSAMEGVRICLELVVNELLRVRRRDVLFSDRTNVHSNMNCTRR